MRIMRSIAGDHDVGALASRPPVVGRVTVVSLALGMLVDEVDQKTKLTRHKIAMDDK